MGEILQIFSKARSGLGLALLGLLCYLPGATQVHQTGGTSIQNQPALAHQDAGGVLVYHAQSPAGPSLQTVSLDSEGQPKGQPLSIKQQFGWALNPALAARPQGDYLLAWQERQGDRFQVFASPLSETGELSQTPVRLSSGAGPAYDPSVASRMDGSLVVWFDLTTGVPTILAHRLAADGTPTGPILTLSNGLTAAHYPAVAPTPQGFLVVWHQLHEGNPRIFSLPLNPQGKALGQPQLADLKSPASYYPSLAVTAQGAAVAFHRLGPGGWQINLQPLTHLGLPDGNSFLLSNENNATYASLVFDGKRFQVAWMERTEHTSQTFINHFDPATGRIGTVRALQTQGHSTFPVLAMSAQGLQALTVDLNGQQEKISRHQLSNIEHRGEVTP